MFAVKGEHRAEVHAGEDVAIHHEHRLLARREQAERACGAERLVFVHVGDFEAEIFPAAEMLLNHLGPIVRRETHAANSRLLQLSDDVLEDRLVAHMQHRLRHRVGERSEPGAKPARHDDGLHRQIGGGRQIVEQRDAADAAGFVEQRQVVDAALVHDAEQFDARRTGARSDRLGRRHHIAAVEEFAGGGVQADACEDGTADVAVGDGVDEPAVGIEDECEPAGVSIDALHRGANRRVGRDREFFERDGIHRVKRRAGTPT